VAYRIGDYPAICKIEAERLVVLVLEVGHRREIYRSCATCLEA
jgi:mRNA interferase RelE/StbE